MRSAILIGLAVFCVVSLSAMCIMWFSQAALAKKHIENVIAAINTPNPILTYDAIETSGFPTRLDINIVKPRINGRLDQWLMATQQPTMPAAGEWLENITFNGDIRISVNALSNEYLFSFPYNWTSTPQIKQHKLSFASQANSDAVCLVQFDNSFAFLKTLWNVESLLEQKWQYIRTFDCALPEDRYVDLATNKLLYSSKGGRLYITQAPHGDLNNLRVYFKLQDMEVTPEGDALFSHYTQLVSNTPSRLAAYGVQNVETDFSYAGPRDVSTLTKDSNVEIHLNKFTYSSALASYDAALQFSNYIDSTVHRGKLKLDAHAAFSLAYQTLLQQMARQVVDQLYAAPSTAPATMQAALQTYSADEFFGYLRPSIPDLYSLGALTQSIDLSYEGTPALNAGKANLSQFEFSATPYGVTANGTAALQANQLFPESDLTITCNNCFRLIDDIANYGERLHGTLSKLSPAEAALFHITPAYAQGMKSFLSAIATPSTENQAKNQLVFTIKSQPSGVSVSGKSLDEVMGLYSQHLAPYAKPADALPALTP
ncbi:MAG: hypothetical protein SFT92_07160 [Rickettsiales bacterium]|nr:hypothetical protein [Rickettsiales bacterium]